MANSGKRNGKGGTFLMQYSGVSADAVKGWGRAARERLHDEKVKHVLEQLI